MAVSKVGSSRISGQAGAEVMEGEGSYKVNSNWRPDSRVQRSYDVGSRIRGSGDMRQCALSGPGRKAIQTDLEHWVRGHAGSRVMQGQGSCRIGGHAG